MRTKIALCICAALSLGAGLSLSGQRPAPPEQKPYRIVNGRVDAATWRGWLAFHSACHGCHGIDAVGTDVAPNLVERMHDMSERDFVTKVLTSYRITVPSGEGSGAAREQIIEEVLRRERGGLVMPAWEGSRVQPHVLDIYAYLKARADGALLPGKPDRMENSGED
jgi:hypothetical protein